MRVRKAGKDLRLSATRHEWTLCPAVPLRHEGHVVAAVRAALPTTTLDAQLATQRKRLLAGGSAFVLVAAVLGSLGARALASPLEEIRRGVERLAAGDFSRRVGVRGSAEAIALADSLNLMAAELDERMKTIQRQASEREAIFSSMREGVLAVDASERVISLNVAERTSKRPVPTGERVSRRASLAISPAITCVENLESAIVVHFVSDPNLDVLCFDANRVGAWALLPETTLPVSLEARTIQCH